jgi:hypothetical protein
MLWKYLLSPVCFVKAMNSALLTLLLLLRLVLAAAAHTVLLMSQYYMHINAMYKGNTNQEPHLGTDAMLATAPPCALRGP